MNQPSYSGLHLMANLHGVNTSLPEMRSTEACADICKAKIHAVGLTIVGEYFHQFEEGGGVTGVVVLAESHVAIHTWPESAYITLDVFVCNFNRDNTQAAQALYESLIAVFEPQTVRRFEVVRE